MSMRMLIDARHPEETRVAVIEGNRIEEFDFESAQREQLKGNIYLAKVTRVEPSLQAAFVEYGGNRHGFLAFSEIHPDYYQIPREDRDALLREEREAADAHRAEMEADLHDDDTAPGSDAGDDEGEALEADGAENADDDDHHEDNATEALRAKRQNLRRRYKIQEVIKRRQVLLVQVVKEERGNKGAALTTYLSLAGRYCVFMPNTNHGGGISRKISSQADRKRLKSIVSELQLPIGMGCIIRTAGLSRTRAEIKRDFDYLTRLWDEIREKTLASTAPALIHEDSDLIKRAIRDIYNRDIDDIVVDGEDGYRAAKAFMKLLMPSHAKKVQQYIDPVPLFQRHQVEAQLAAMYQPVVQLKSGGYIVINPTEALVSIDINSGKSTREHNIEETALKTNVEAAKEIARQLRLRDMAGLVVIDFIDMDFHANNRKVEKALKDALKNDRARIQVGRISSFGLLEMSRQRLRTGVLEASTHVCPMCDGAGIVRTLPSAALGAVRILEAEALRGKHSHFILRLPFEVAIYTLNVKRAQIARIEHMYGISVEVTPNGELTIGEHEIDGSGPPPVARVELPLPVADDADEDEDDTDSYTDEDDEDDTAETSPGERQQRDERGSERREPRGEDGRPRKRRRRGRSRRDREDGRQDSYGEVPDVQADEAADIGETLADAETAIPREVRENRDEGESEGSRRKRRRRGRRGGRRKPGEGLEPSSAVGTDAADDNDTGVDPDQNALAEPVTAAPAAPAKPKRAPRRKAVADNAVDAPAPEATEAIAEKPKRKSRAKSSPAVDADTAATPVETATPAPKPARRKAAAQRADGPETVAESALDTVPANDGSANAQDEETGPSRKGWWQRTFGA